MKEFLSRYLYVLGARRKKLVGLIGLFVALAFLDLIGIGLIGPFIAAVSAPEIMDRSACWRAFRALVGGGDDRMALVWLSVIIIAIFYAKSCWAFWAQRYIVKFGYGRQSDLMNTLISTYQAMPYEYHVQHNSAALIQAIIRHTDVYTSQMLIASLRLASDTIVFLMILAFLALTNLTATICMILLLVVVAAVYNRIVKHRIQRSGKQMADAQKNIIRNVNHAIGGFKEIRLLGVESYFEEEAARHGMVFANAGATFRALSLLPRYFIECSMVTFIAGMAIVLMLAGQDTQSFLPTLGIFGMAAIRLMPSANVVAAGINDVRYAKYALDELYEDLTRLCRQGQTGPIPCCLPAGAPAESRAGRTAFETISMNDVSFRYTEASDYALRGVSLDIQRGRSIGLIGRSGSGKTTLINVLLGLLAPQEGAITVDGHVVDDPRQWFDIFAYIPQDVHLTDDTIRRNIAFGIADHSIDEQRIEAAIRDARLEEVIRQLPEGIGTVVGERGIRLSGGQKQRVALARAFYHDRQVVVMDEATASLDNETEHEIVEAVRRLKGQKTLIVVAHRLTTVRHCDIIYRLESGRVVAVGDFESVVGVV